jgi:beta-glucosidase
VNFGNFIYSNLEVSFPASTIESVSSNATVTPDAPFVNYQEGIYFGYRYYETAAAEGFINYDEAVVYPFGYGLSFTDFEWEVTNSDLGAVDGTISVDLKVTNTGTQAGKDVVELFYSAPYTSGGIEKAEVVLGGFAKTGLIEPGQSETVTVTLAVEDMASYDYEENRAYVLEAGDYELTLRTDSHMVAQGVEPLTYTVDETVVYSGDNSRSSDKTEVTNQFDDVSAAFTDTPEEGKILNMSRADFAGTFPKAPTADLLIANDEVAAGFQPYDAEAAAEASDATEPATGKSTDLTLVDLRGLPIDDPKWDELLDSLSVDDMTTMLLNGAYQTAAILSIAKPVTTDLDGPAGFSSFINASINGVAYPSEVLIAQTWNADMAYAMGEMLGNEAIFKDVAGWYAPAMNLHRSPFAGRNFEYYSEDPFLSGIMATAASNGAAQKGLYTTLKHFALNDQETNRVNNGIATWANEQTIREIYLKPFEMAVKNIEMPVPYISDENGTISETTVGSTAVMSSFNRIGSVWAGGSVPLMTNVLRGEWGFEGFAISDFNLYRYMNPNQSIAAGTDLTLTFAPSKSFDDTTSAYARTNIRNATHNILFAVANSNAMNGVAPGATVTYTPPTWRYIQIGVSAALGLLVVAGGVLVVRRVRKHKAA